jgi:general L-amino acid transport system permease protein
MEALRRSLFSSPLNSAITIAILTIILLALPGLLRFLIFDAVFGGNSGAACQGAEGACWPFIGAKLGQIVYGYYPEEQRWRVNVVFLLGAAGIAGLMIPRTPHKRWLGLAMVTAYPLLAIALLAAVPTKLWGGLLVTLVVSVAGTAGAFPLAILLALGRRSSLSVLRALSIGFIELWRGVPLVTVLFMASVMLPLFLPEGVTFDLLLRCIIGVALFAAANMAETIRGGLQAIPRGQYEAATALGLGYWQSMGLVILPQALRLVIPGLVNSIIALFKDTTLVLIVGLADFLGVIQRNLNDPAWASPSTAATAYVFAGFVFWLFCFGLSRYAKSLENRS